MSLIFLIGMPAAGKTFWGRAWAQQHNWAFADLDESVETLAGVTVEQIFASAGEEGFRAIESHVLDQIISGAKGVNTIIATGGGTPASGGNMKTMMESGCVVYLKARLRTILHNLKNPGPARPLLERASEAEVEALLEARTISYNQAYLTIDVEKIGETTFAQILKTCTNRRL